MILMEIEHDTSFAEIDFFSFSLRHSRIVINLFRWWRQGWRILTSLLIGRKSKSQFRKVINFIYSS